MNILLISKYINKLTKDDIKTFAYNKGILLEEYEIDIIYFYIKKYYKEFLQGNDLLILNKLKKEISITILLTYIMNIKEKLIINSKHIGHNLTKIGKKQVQTTIFLKYLL